MKHLGLKIFLLSTCLILLAMFIFVVCLWNCALKPSENPKYEDRQVGDFDVRFYEDYCEIKGTTEQGNKKKNLVIPAYIDGVRVESLGYGALAGAIDMIPTDLTYPKIESEMIEKVYFETNIKVYPYSFVSDRCPNLKKIMYPKSEVYPYVLNRSGFTVYYPRSLYENDESEKIETERANVSYYYNYENAGNEGYYWIDDCDYGNVIEFIPPSPVREGYTFGGWYKEADCINLWDFAGDVLPEEKLDQILKVKPAYQETILYAKWI